MKKYFFMAVAGMLALSSCSNDSDEMIVTDGPHPMTFIAGYGDGADTRTTLGAELTVSWEGNEHISILSSKNNNKDFSTTSTGSKATFSGTAANDDKFYAVYPYTEGLTLDGTTIKGIKIPTTQYNAVWGSGPINVKSEGWDPEAPVALAVTGTDMKLHFSNLCAILKATIKGGYPIYSIEVSADEELAGTFDLNTTNNKLTVISGSGSNVVTTGSGSGHEITANGDRIIYLAVAPGTYHNFKFTYYWKASSYSSFNSKIKSTPVTFAAGKIYDLTPSTTSHTGSVSFSKSDFTGGGSKTLTATKYGVTVKAEIIGSTTATFAEETYGYKPNANDVQVQISASGKTVTSATIFGALSGPGPWTFTYNNDNWALNGTTTSYYSSVFDGVTIYYTE